MEELVLPHFADIGRIVSLPKLSKNSAAKTEQLERIRNILLSKGSGGMECELSLLKIGLKESNVK